MLRPNRTGNVLQPGQVHVQYISVKEQQRLQCLVLRTCTDLAFDGQMGQELLNADCTQVPGLMSLMKPQVTPNSLQPGLFRAKRQMPCTHLLPRNLQQPRPFHHAPWHPGGLCDTTPPAREWNQVVRQWPTTISDTFVRFYPTTSVVYI